MKEEEYVFAQDLTRIRIAIAVLHEIIHEDFKVDDIVANLRQQEIKAYKRKLIE